MRFRAKFGLLGWVQVAFVLFVLVLMLSPGQHNGNQRFFVVLPTLVLTVLRILSQIFIYWDINSDGLHVRRFWDEKTIPWQEVTHVGAQSPKHVSSDVLAIDYFRSAPMSDRGSVIANPEDRQQFLSTLRRYAPQAVFDV